MTDRVTLLKNIEHLGRIYCVRYLDWDRDKLESDWFTALSFFFGNSFMRGRRDEMSNEYYCFTLNRLQNDYLGCEDRDAAYRSLQGRSHEFETEILRAFKRKYKLGRKSASNHERFAEEVAGHNELIRLLTTPKMVEVMWEGTTYTKEIRLGNDEDVLMVLDTLKFICTEPRRNIYTYLRGVIRTQSVRAAQDELTSIRAVGDKISSLVMRDIGLMNAGLIREGFDAAFPVDTWVKQLAGKLGCTATTEVGIKKYFIEQCEQASVTPTLFAAGLWYLGYNTLDILLKYFLGEHEIREHREIEG
jgi:hypothetical protein